MDILLNGTLVEELSTLVHGSTAKERASRMCAKLLEIIPRQQFLIAVQACVGCKVLARENIKPYRKDVSAKLVKIQIKLFCYTKFLIIKIFIFLRSMVVT